MVITVDKFLHERDVDAALYLLSKMLDLEVGEKRPELENLFKSIKKRRTIDPYERRQIVTYYREVVG